MLRQNLSRCLEVLELPQRASWEDVQNAYLHLKSLYSGDSIAMAPVEYELSEHDRKRILHEIERAYYEIKSHFNHEGLKTKDEKDLVSWKARKPVPSNELDSMEFSGAALREVRKRYGVDIFEISSVTKVPHHQITNLEEERYDRLPPPVFIKGFLQAYAKCLCLDPHKVVRDYMRRYRERNSSRGS